MTVYTQVDAALQAEHPVELSPITLQIIQSYIASPIALRDALFRINTPIIHSDELTMRLATAIPLHFFLNHLFEPDFYCFVASFVLLLSIGLYVVLATSDEILMLKDAGGEYDQIARLILRCYRDLTDLERRIGWGSHSIFARNGDGT